MIKKTNIYLLQKFREIVWFFVVVKIEGVYIYHHFVCLFWSSFIIQHHAKLFFFSRLKKFLF